MPTASSGWTRSKRHSHRATLTMGSANAFWMHCSPGWRDIAARFSSLPHRITLNACPLSWYAKADWMRYFLSICRNRKSDGRFLSSTCIVAIGHPAVLTSTHSPTQAKTLPTPKSNKPLSHHSMLLTPRKTSLTHCIYWRKWNEPALCRWLWQRKYNTYEIGRLIALFLLISRSSGSIITKLIPSHKRLHNIIVGLWLYFLLALQNSWLDNQ